MSLNDIPAIVFSRLCCCSAAWLTPTEMVFWMTLQKMLFPANVTLTLLISLTVLGTAQMNPRSGKADHVLCFCCPEYPSQHPIYFRLNALL